MLRRLLVGVARILFSTALLLTFCAAGAVYLSYRVVRWAIADDKPAPVKDAAFAAMVAGAVLAKAVKDEQERRTA